MLMSVGQFPTLLRNPTFRCHVRNSPPIVPILILANPVHTLPPHFFKTRRQSAILTRGLIPSYFPTITLYEIPLFTTCATSPANNIIFHNTYMARHTNNEDFFFFGVNSPKPAEAASLLRFLNYN